LLSVDSASAQSWIAGHKYPLLVWRLGLYSITARVWWKLRLRFITGEGREAAAVRRAEIAALLSIVLIEATNWLPQLNSLGAEGT
jgi:hypothetical protein